VGAARSVFTGRSVFRSGMDMFVVGLGVAAVGYFVGEWIGGML
jgi:VIT1/CCC1 family predicted Fe2+/Mn2+ transporter